MPTIAQNSQGATAIHMPFPGVDTPQDRETARTGSLGEITAVTSAQRQMGQAGAGAPVSGDVAPPEAARAHEKLTAADFLNRVLPAMTESLSTNVAGTDASKAVKALQTLGKFDAAGELSNTFPLVRAGLLAAYREIEAMASQTPMLRKDGVLVERGGNGVTQEKVGELLERFTALCDQVDKWVGAAQPLHAAGAKAAAKGKDHSGIHAHYSKGANLRGTVTKSGNELAHGVARLAEDLRKMRYPAESRPDGGGHLFDLIVEHMMVPEIAKENQCSQQDAWTQHLDHANYARYRAGCVALGEAQANSPASEMTYIAHMKSALHLYKTGEDKEPRPQVDQGSREPRGAEPDEIDAARPADGVPAANPQAGDGNAAGAGNFNINITVSGNNIHYGGDSYTVSRDEASTVLDGRTRKAAASSAVSGERMAESMSSVRSGPKRAHDDGFDYRYGDGVYTLTFTPFPAPMREAPGVIAQRDEPAVITAEDHQGVATPADDTEADVAAQPDSVVRTDDAARTPRQAPPASEAGGIDDQPLTADAKRVRFGEVTDVPEEFVSEFVPEEGLAVVEPATAQTVVETARHHEPQEVVSFDHQLQPRPETVRVGEVTDVPEEFVSEFVPKEGLAVVEPAIAQTVVETARHHEPQEVVSFDHQLQPRPETVRVGEVTDVPEEFVSEFVPKEGLAVVEPATAQTVVETARHHEPQEVVSFDHQLQPRPETVRVGEVTDVPEEFVSEFVPKEGLAVVEPATAQTVVETARHHEPQEVVWSDHPLQPQPETVRTSSETKEALLETSSSEGVMTSAAPARKFPPVIVPPRLNGLAQPKSGTDLGRTAPAAAYTPLNGLAQPKSGTDLGRTAPAAAYTPLNGLAQPQAGTDLGRTAPAAAYTPLNGLAQPKSGTDLGRTAPAAAYTPLNGLAQPKSGADLGRTAPAAAYAPLNGLAQPQAGTDLGRTAPAATYTPLNGLAQPQAGTDLGRTAPAAAYTPLNGLAQPKSGADLGRTAPAAAYAPLNGLAQPQA
ncbi:hypothetical protein ACOTFF_13890, partial [Achromobacter xylosoxidans]